MVYVDDMYRYPLGRFRGMKMSHLVADTRAELLDMATRIGVAHKWLQHGGTPDEHFDICLSKRALAVAAGAQEVTLRELAALVGERRRRAGSAEQA